MSQEGDSSIFFMQPRVSVKDDVSTYNFGIGHRRLINDNLLVGMNVFGDYVDKNDHSRIGAGVEVLNKRFELRANSYFATSAEKETEKYSDFSLYEKAVNGFDIEVGAVVPCMPWMTVYGSRYGYDFKYQDNLKGWKSRVEMDITDSLTLEGYVDDYAGSDKETYGLMITLNLLVTPDMFKINKPLCSKANEFDRDLAKEMLEPVKRNNEIVVETYVKEKSNPGAPPSSTASISVKVGRA